MTRTTPFLALAAVLAACAEAPSMPEAASAEVSVELRREPVTDPAQLQGIAAARRATARYHRYESAKDTYTFLFMDMCMEDDSPEQLGGMGYHYVNTRLLDGEVDIAEPEALMYEPGPDGQRRLVGVEYVIPEGEWEGPGTPTLLGQEMELNGFGLYALHVWLWKDNPAGIYKPWNATVSCANAHLVDGGAH